MMIDVNQVIKQNRKASNLPNQAKNHNFGHLLDQYVFVRTISIIFPFMKS